MTEHRRPETITQLLWAHYKNNLEWAIAALAGKKFKSTVASKTATIVDCDRRCLRKYRSNLNENSTHHTA